MAEPDAGLFNDEIGRMMKPWKSQGFVGVFSSDEIDKVETAAKLAKVAKRKLPIAFVMNTDTSDGPGIHWVSILIDPYKYKSFEYYDSFGDEPNPILVRDLTKLAKNVYGASMTLPKLQLKINRIKQQSVSTMNCGYFAMKFLIDRFDGVPFPKSTGFDNSKNGEKSIAEFKKKFAPFKYINTKNV